MLVSPSSLQVSELVPHQASKLSSKHKPVSKYMTPSLMFLIGLPMLLLGVLHKELNFYCCCSNPNAENVTWPSLILVASLPSGADTRISPRGGRLMMVWWLNAIK